jgi:hypothetical protein
MKRIIDMNKAFQIALARLLDPLVLRGLHLDDADTSVTRAPRPEPEILGIPQYHKSITDRNFVAAAVQREALMALETEVLLTVAESYAVSYRARAVMPLIMWKP